MKPLSRNQLAFLLFMRAIREGKIHRTARWTCMNEDGKDTYRLEADEYLEMGWENIRDYVLQLEEERAGLMVSY